MLCILAQLGLAAFAFFIPIPPLVSTGLSLVPFSAFFLPPDAGAMMPLVSLVTLLVVNQRAKELP